MAILVTPVTLYEGETFTVPLRSGSDSTADWPAAWSTSSEGVESPATAESDYGPGSWSGLLSGVTPFKVVTYADGIVEGTEHFRFTFSYTTDAVVGSHQVSEWTFTLLDAMDKTGSSAANTMDGTPGSDKLSGVGGNDVLNGLGADDTLIGGAGSDKLAGGEGKDRLTGNGGADKFVFAETGSANADTITDFLHGTDKILLDDAAFTHLVPKATGGLQAASFHIGNAAQAAGDHVIYDPGSGKLYYDPDGTGAHAKQLIATLAGSPDDLSFSDFRVS